MGDGIEPAAQLAANKLSKMLDPRHAHVGIGGRELVVYVMRSKSMTKRFEHTLPKEIDGYAVRVEYVGRIRPASE